MGILPPGSEVISIHAFVLTMKHFYRDHVCFTSTNGFSSFPPRLQKEPLWQRAGGFDKSSLVHLTKGSLSNLILKGHKVSIYLPMINYQPIFPVK